MDQTRTARSETQDERSSADREAQAAKDGIRTLDELELMMAGGGDGTPGWP